MKYWNILLLHFVLLFLSACVTSYQGNAAILKQVINATPETSESQTQSHTVAKLNTDYRITPLIHSASITLFQQQISSRANVEYRVVGDTHWLKAHPLQWEPVNKALSGSLVYLNENTEYEARVSVTNGTQHLTNIYRFKTRPNTPPVDPEKVVYLRDIYKGGSIDASTLKLEGTKTGWAKLIGTGVVIKGDDAHDFALKLADMRYVVIEDITIKHAKRFGVQIADSHDVWISGCDISRFGRKAAVYRDGVGYESEDAERPINFDSGIKAYRSGRVVVEHCTIYQPNISANNWDSGHPNGASAMLVHGNHNDETKQGQFIVRYNRFYGTDENRFNDVIEGISNFRVHGAFTRDSAIHDNYLAYANDDVIELDGGQHNVLFYRNEVTRAYVGVSVAPNMRGPSYIFHNYIHSLGDNRGQHWAAFKMGGLFSAPAGKTLVFENKVDVSRIGGNGNGVATGGVKGDEGYWVHTQNNVFIHRAPVNRDFGHGIFDKVKYEENRFINDSFINTADDNPKWYQGFNAANLEPRLIQKSDNVKELSDDEHFEFISIERAFLIPNFSRITNQRSPINGERETQSQSTRGVSNQRLAHDTIIVGQGTRRH